MLHFITGAPRSGLTVLSACLRILGLTPLTHEGMADPATINGLLLQDMGRTPFMVAPMPSDWLQSDAAAKARSRIKKLIGDIGHTDQSYYLSDPLFCKSLPLWLEVIKEMGMAVNCIHILRHPWEVAQSLNTNKHIDLIKAHILWLSCTRSAIRAMKDHAYALITFDQLLADPVSALHSLRLTSSASILSSHYSLIDMVQPSQKHHHAAMLPDPEKKTCRPLERLYNQLRTSRYSDADLSFLPYESEKAVQKRGLPEKKIPLIPDIVDILLQVIGQQECEIDCIPYVPHSKNASFQKGSSPHQLYFRIGFDPNDLTDFPLLPDQWEKITIPVHQPNQLRHQCLFISPLNTIGTVRISAVTLLNEATGQAVWSAKSSPDFARFEIENRAIRLPDHDNLMILVTGEDSLVKIRVEGIALDCPLVVEVWVKAGRGVDMLHGDHYMILGRDDSSIQQLLADPLIWSNAGHVHALDVLLTTHQNMEVLKSFLPPLPEKKKRKMYQGCLGVKSINSAYHVIMRAITENNKIAFKDAVIAYHDDWGVWTCMDELLIHQEYYFTAETDQPRILDCGANIGLAVYYFKHLYPKAKITAFEPVPAFRQLIEKNVVDNKWQNVEVLPYAIDGVDGKANFYVSKKMSLAGTLTERRKVAGDELEKIAVTSKRLRHYLERPVDYLKLDIEGSEDAALLDAAPLLGNVQHIFCEYHHALSMNTDRLKKILDVLDKAGFDYHVSKSVNYTKNTSYRPMKYIEAPYSALVFAKNKDWETGRQNASSYLCDNQS